MTAEGAPWLEAVGLTKAFDGAVAVARADLAVRAGEVRGIVGPNGAGKSTLVQMLSGLLSPDSGEIRIDGQAVKFRGPADAISAGIALVSQEMLLSPHLTVAENIVLGREPRRLARVRNGQARVVARRALDRLEAAIDPDTPISDLAGVERRLVMVARALASDARLIILDEPTAALAPQEADAILSVVTTLAANGVSFLYVSHRFDDIERVATAVTGVRDAQIVANLAREEIQRQRLVALVSPVDEQERQQVVRRPPRPPRTPDTKIVLQVRDLVGEPLRGVSLDIEAGEILGVAGLSGSGADELMAFVSGIEDRASGTVRAGEAVLASGDRIAAARAGVAYVPGDRSQAILPNHDIKSNISVSSLRELSSYGVPSARREVREVRVLMNKVRLSGGMTNAVSSLSGGNQQKAVFARWMARDATVLMLHDPTAGVDVRARAEIHERIRELAASGIGVLLVTTDISELIDLSDRIIVLNRGRAITTLAGDAVDESSVLAAMAAAHNELTPEPASTFT